MLISFFGVLSSQTKLYRVKQGREKAHEVISTNSMLDFIENAYLHRIVCAVLSLIARHNSDI